MMMGRRRNIDYVVSGHPQGRGVWVWNTLSAYPRVSVLPGRRRSVRLARGFSSYGCLGTRDRGVDIEGELKEGEDKLR